ncbi:fructosamine kinase family protein [Marinobacter sp. 1Y8]
MRDIAIDTLLRELGLPEITRTESVGGGSISQAFKALLSDGRTVFIKRLRNAPAGFFQAEADGLRAMADVSGCRVPVVLGVSEQGLVLEWLEGTPAGDFGEQLGRGLATLHASVSGQFGFHDDNFCGLTPQPNPWMTDGHAFFADARLIFQAKRARDAGLLNEPDVSRLETLAAKLPEWVPPMPASLIHGDLWSGNVHCDGRGAPVLIDPAVHYGWAEADLAMTTLFGRQSPAFYDAYLAASDIVGRDWEERAPLYNLYHLLNHLNLFGGSYRSQVMQVLRRYV